MSDAATIVRRLGALKGNRLPHETVWRDCYDYTSPLRGSGFQSSDLDAGSGQSRKARLVDGTATDAARLHASSLSSGITPATSIWFAIEIEDSTLDEKTWLEDSSYRIFKLIHGANFDSESLECYTDITIVGWCALFVEEAADKQGFAFEQWPLAEVYCGMSKRGGRVDIVYREFQLTAEQAVKEYGEKNLSAALLKVFQTKPDTQFTFIHCIEPNDEYVAKSTLSKKLAFSSTHVEVKSQKLVRRGGFNEFPVIVPRWQKLPKSAYAVGPTFDALPDIKMINELGSMELANADITICGMWIAEDDGVLNPRNIKVGPRKVITANSVESMKALQSGGNWQYSMEKAAQLQSTIRKIYLADQLQPQDGPAMTATEVHVRVALIRQLLGPVYGRLTAEWTQPMIERCFGMAMRMGLLAQPPASIQGKTFRIKYTSPLARAQRAEDVTAMDEFELTLQQEAALDPSVLDNYDLDAAVQLRAELKGVPSKLMRSVKAITDIRTARAKQQQAAQQAQAAAQAQLSAADSAGKTIGQQVAA